MPTILREHAEQQFAEELIELAKSDKRQRPPNWKLSPWSVVGRMGSLLIPSLSYHQPPYPTKIHFDAQLPARVCRRRDLFLHRSYLWPVANPDD
jgi:hypothetical protein